jgi:hypothetical protein
MPKTPVFRPGQFIDAMAQHKLNVLHWHATDAISLPLASAAFPNLTLGAFSDEAVYSLEDVEALLGADSRGPGAPQDSFASRRGPLGLKSSPYRESAIGNAPALVPGPWLDCKAYSCSLSDHPKPESHRADPESGSTLRLL